MYLIEYEDSQYYEQQEPPNLPEDVQICCEHQSTSEDELCYETTLEDFREDSM